MNTIDGPFPVTRINVEVPDLLAFKRAYEEAVPAVPAAEIEAMTRRQASWHEMIDFVNSVAPYGFLIYARIDVDPVMSLAGNHNPCTTYLMGNHTIAERMFRHDPRVMLYAPLRTVIWGHTDGTAWFTVDQPSTQFASFGAAQISSVGVELDTKLAALLTALGLKTPATLLG